jgi:hypothetical protein
MDRVHIILNTKVLGSVFQNSQAKDARQKKARAGEHLRMFKRL